MKAMEPQTPVEAKVKSATVGAAVAGVVVWALESFVFGGQVPGAVQAAIDVLVPGAAALAAGWLARHTPRADPAAVDPRTSGI